MRSIRRRRRGGASRQKDQHVDAQRAAMSGIIATQHRDVVKLPPDDRRFSVITCGGKMTAAQTATIRAWMAVPENIGALYRALLATPAAPLDVFDPFDDPPPFAGRLEMIGMAKSEVEDAYEAAIGALEGFPLFTLTQALRLIGYFGGASGSEGQRAGQAHRHQECLPAARAGRALQPHLVSRAAGDPLRPYGARPAALASGRQGDDRRVA